MWRMLRHMLRHRAGVVLRRVVVVLQMRARVLRRVVLKVPAVVRRRSAVPLRAQQLRQVLAVSGAWRSALGSYDRHRHRVVGLTD